MAASMLRRCTVCPGKLQNVLQSPSLSEFRFKRTLWGWLNSVFNRVDKDRIKTAGANRACAEWLLRCGASLRWKGLDHWERDYNRLPGGNFDRYKIVEIDASDSAVMSIGFPHLEGLKDVRKLVLHNCGYLDDAALDYLPLLKESLEELQLSSCGDITDKSITPIKQLHKLQQLVMYDLPEIRDKEKAMVELTQALPKCEIDYKDLNRNEE